MQDGAARRRIPAAALAIGLVGLIGFAGLVGMAGLAGTGCGKAPGSQRAGADSTAAGAGAGGGLFGQELPQPTPKPDFTLTDFNGRRYQFAPETAGKLTLLFFGYTHCPDVCPVHMANLAAVLARMPRAQADRVQVVFVTTDPVRDTPARLREWLATFDPTFIGLTGTREELLHAQQVAGVAPSVAQPAAGDTGYAVGHAAQVLAYTPDGMLRAQYPFGTRQREWAHDLPILLGGTGGEVAGPAAAQAVLARQAAAGLRVEPGYARIAPTRDMGAGYFIAINGTSVPDTLRAVTVAGARNATLHTLRTSNGIVQMVPLGTPVIAPGDSLVLREGGDHLMFDLPRPARGAQPSAANAARATPAAHETLDVTLRFARAGEKHVRLPVRPYGEEGGK
jgi:protein SCO1/2